ncbi:uridine kinase [Marinomonas ostreistagni]|uniref:uridine kinase n=1 Tax=Marinomonas ostreistagni TaxID=359209 RepID=UPI001F304BAA|nr:uridine kinase [Marinomonas ostreistagni]
MWNKCLSVVTVLLTAAIASSHVGAEEPETPEVIAETQPSYAKGAELFGVEFNDLSKTKFEDHLTKMGLEPYPSYRAGVANYSLGATGILGIKELTVVYNRYEFVEHATMSGVVESPELRAKLGNLLESKYGPPSIGFVRNGYGRARWMLRDGTEIELHNTTFDVSVSYIDRVPKRVTASGRIDVEALLRRSQ